MIFRMIVSFLAILSDCPEKHHARSGRDPFGRVSNAALRKKSPRLWIPNELLQPWVDKPGTIGYAVQNSNKKHGNPVRPIISGWFCEIVTGGSQMFKSSKSASLREGFAPTGAPESVNSQSTRAHTDIKRELIRVVLKDTLRQHGIPFDWLACEVIIIRRGPVAEELHIQLVVMKWNESLMRYAMALQQQLLKGLDRFDPSVDHSQYVVSWRFAPDCGCPFNVMPNPKAWLQKAPPPFVDEAPSILDRRKTRRPKDAPIFSRDQASGRGDADDADYPSTRLSPLR
jgi:hypothetical protein